MYAPVGAKIIDEFSQLQGSMNHAAALRATYGRQAKYNLNMYDYAMPKERWGRIALLLYCGDHLQLPPVPKKTSLLAPLEGSSKEHKAGAAIFANVECVFMLEQMMRFTNPRLRRILDTMRNPKGKLLSKAELISKALERLKLPSGFNGV